MKLRFMYPTLLLACAGAHAADAVYAGAANCRIVDTAPAPGRTADWNGACKDGYADGPGALQWSVDGKEADRYEGILARGLPNGEGIYQRADGILAQGTYRDGMLHGKGIIAATNGDKLIARFENGAVVGPVRFLEAEGDRYEGDWNGGADGAGTRTFALGGSYRGQWRQGKPYGEGEIVYPNGQVLKGNFNGSFQLGAAADAQPQAGTYNVKRADPRLGTHMPAYAGLGYVVPPDRGYAALTPEQQLVVKQPYKILQADDAPPYPQGGMVELSRALSRVGGHAQERGRVRANVLVDEKGVAQSAAVLKAPSREFGDMVGKLLMVIKYTPGRCAGQPCAMTVPYNYEFTLEP